MGIVLHNFQYMPDGRPISWPAEFKDQATEVARALGVPALDYAPFVVEHGAARVMAPDLRHWNADFYPQVSQHLFDFVHASVLGR